MHIVYFMGHHPLGQQGHHIQLPAAPWAGEGWRCNECVWLVPGTGDEL